MPPISVNQLALRLANKFSRSGIRDTRLGQFPTCGRPCCLYLAVEQRNDKIHIPYIDLEGRRMNVCENCRGTKKCQSCGGTGIGVLETVHNLDDTANGIRKLPSLNPCQICDGTGKCQACIQIAKAAASTTPTLPSA